MGTRRRMASMAAATFAALLLSACALVVGEGPDLERAVPGALSAEVIRFTASGDIGTSDEAAGTLEQIGELGSDLHFALGDLSYGETGEEDAWCGFVDDRVDPDVPFELLAGNHESDGRDGDIDAFAECLPNRLPGLQGEYARQYAVDVPEADPLVRFVMISPGIDFGLGPWSYAEGTERYEWTRAAIDGAHAAGIPWIVVGMHKPCLSVGDYGCDAGAGIVDLLVSRGVDLVLTGHEHLYQRSAQLGFSDGCTTIAPEAITAACVVDDGTALRQGRGTVFVTVGTGGTTLRDVHPDDPQAEYFVAWSGANAEPSRGNLAVRVTRSSLDAEFAASLGSFADRIRITAAD